MTPSEYLRDHCPWHHIELLLSLHAHMQNVEIALRGEDWFARHRSASDAAGLKELATRPGVQELHLGAVWPEMMSKRTAARLAPVGKSPALDFDLQDFPIAVFFNVAKDDQPGNDALFDVVALGVKVVQEALRSAFGFEDTAAFYSGRRGAHLWLLDKRAFDLTHDARVAVVAALRAKGASDFPSFNSAVDLLVEGFPKLRAWKEERFVRHFVSELGIHIIDTEQVLASTDPWQTIVGKLNKEWMHQKLRRVVVELAWPRLDEGAAALQHLIKAPLGVHASTGRIAVPLTDDFDPSMCPSIADPLSMERILKGFPLLRRIQDPLDW